MTLEKTSSSTWTTQMRTYRLWPCDLPHTPRKPCREYRLVIIDLHIKGRNSIGWRMLRVLPWWFLFVTRYNISSFIKRLNFSNCAEWARSALERCHEHLKCARDFLVKTQFSGAVIWWIWTSTYSTWTAHCGRRSVIGELKERVKRENVLSFSWAGAELGIRQPRAIKCVFYN